MIPRASLRTALRIRPRRTRPRVRAGSGRFANRLLARFLQRGVVPQSLELLLSMRTPAFVQNFLQRCDVEITTPSLMTLVRERNLQQSLAPPADAGRRASAASSARRWLRRSNERAEAATTLMYLVQRAVRLESMPSHSAAPGNPAPPALVDNRSAGDGAAAMTVVRRPIDAQSPRNLVEQKDSRASERKADRFSQGDPRDPFVAGAPARRPNGDVDIEHLADRVISSIDRRIVAQRERLGRP
jgi:hypothetical protein